MYLNVFCDVLLCNRISGISVFMYFTKGIFFSLSVMLWASLHYLTSFCLSIRPSIHQIVCLSVGLSGQQLLNHLIQRVRLDKDWIVPTRWS